MRMPGGHSSAASDPVGGERGLDRGRGRVEDRDGRVALAHRLDQAAAAGLDGVGDQLVVAHERLGHRLRMRFPQRRRALDVRAAERHHAGRQRLRPAGPQALDELARGLRPALRVRRHPEPDRGLELLCLRRVEALPRGQHAGGRRAGEQRERGRRERVDVARS